MREGKPKRCAKSKCKNEVRRYMNVFCDECNEKSLQIRIQNRDTDLQRAYDIACYDQEEAEKKIILLEQELLKVRGDLKKANNMIDRCIAREAELGMKVL